MSLLVTLFLVLVNIFNNITTNTPKAEGEKSLKVFEHIYSFLIKHSRSDGNRDMDVVVYPFCFWCISR